MYLGLQEQLYEPLVLVQEAFGSQLFILTAWALLHSSMSEREQTYYLKIMLKTMSLGDTENCHKIPYSYSLNIDVYNKESKIFPKKNRTTTTW